MTQALLVSLTVIIGLIGLVTSQRFMIRSPYLRPFGSSHRGFSRGNIFDIDRRDSPDFGDYNVGLADIGVGGLLGRRGMMGGFIGRRPVRPVRMQRRIGGRGRMGRTPIILGDFDMPDPDYPDVVFASRQSIRSPFHAAQLQQMTDAERIVVV